MHSICDTKAFVKNLSINKFENRAILLENPFADVTAPRFWNVFALQSIGDWSSWTGCIILLE